jgi:hypothetical protein
MKSQVTLANNSSIEVIGKGSINIVNEVLHCLNARHTLISVSKLIEDGYLIVFRRDGADNLMNNIQLLRARLKNGLFLILISDLLPTHIMASTHITMLVMLALVIQARGC